MHYVLAVSVIALYIYFRFGSKALAGALLVIALLAMTRGLFAISVPLLVIAFGILKQTEQLPKFKFPINRNRNKTKSTSNKSLPPKYPTIKGRFIELYLNDDTGSISGKIIKGTHALKMIEKLKLADLKYLMKAYHQTDKDSEQLLLCYMAANHQDILNELNKTNPNGGPDNNHTREQNITGGANVAMSRVDASMILGLSKHPGEAEIKSAHRSLMKKFHPDQGGTQYLATKINMAKDLLLK